MLSIVVEKRCSTTWTSFPKSCKRVAAHRESCSCKQSSVTNDHSLKLTVMVKQELLYFLVQGRRQ